jgi:hypothetical protein
MLKIWRFSGLTIQYIHSQIEVPLISRYIKTEEAKWKAFYHIMKSKIGNDEVFSQRCT